MGQSWSRSSLISVATALPDSPPVAPESPSDPALGPLTTPDTPVEVSLLRIIHCFHQYAAREGDVETLSLQELHALLSENLPRFMDGLGRSEPFCIAQLFQAADKDRDQQICFDEFLYVLGKLVKDYHLQYHRRLCAHYCTQHGLY